MTDVQEQTDIALIEEELAPLNIIRNETVLSKMPIHNLSKKGKVDIHIVRKNNNGQVELKWEISYSDRYGQARQLAYRLDTHVIARRIEAIGRPLPEMINIGSLNQLAEELNSNKNDVKRALQQNATTSINAKLGYKAADGTERTLEALFTRYSVVFTGEKLPDGSRASEVYLVLNKPYREVLNNAPTRPLDFDYLKSLSPSTQRFYEIVSFKIYAALKYDYPYAKMTYSEYCMFSAQERYYDYDHFKKQMYKVHRPHLASGYLAKVWFEPAQDQEGKQDWTMCYQPGPKARAEYRTFTKDPKRFERQALAAKPFRRGRKGVQKQLTSAPPKLANTQEVYVQELTKRGVLENAARELVQSLPEQQQVLDQLEWGDHLIRKKEMDNPPGFYLYLVRGDVNVPPDFETSRKRRLREEAERHASQEAVLRYEIDHAFDEYQIAEIDRYIQVELKPLEYQVLIENERANLKSKHQSMWMWTDEALENVSRIAVRKKIREQLNLMDFEEFSARYREQLDKSLPNQALPTDRR
jgi:hypothetical protein